MLSFRVVNCSQTTMLSLYKLRFSIYWFEYFIPSTTNKKSDQPKQPFTRISNYFSTKAIAKAIKSVIRVRVIARGGRITLTTTTTTPHTIRYRRANGRPQFRRSSSSPVVQSVSRVPNRTLIQQLFTHTIYCAAVTEKKAEM